MDFVAAARRNSLGSSSMKPMLAEFMNKPGSSQQKRRNSLSLADLAVMKQMQPLMKSASGSALNYIKEKSLLTPSPKAKNAPGFPGRPISPVKQNGPMSKSLTSLPSPHTRLQMNRKLSPLPTTPDHSLAHTSANWGDCLPVEFDDGRHNTDCSRLFQEKAPVPEVKINSVDSEKSTAPGTPLTDRSDHSASAGSGSRNASKDTKTTDDSMFVVPEAPSVAEALQRFESGVFSDAEAIRLRRAYQRFKARSEDLDKEQLELVASHLGYLLDDEQDLELLFDEVSSMSTLDFEELSDFVSRPTGLVQSQRDVIERAFSKQVQEDLPSHVRAEKLPDLLKEFHIIALSDNIEELLQRAGLAGKPLLNRDDVAMFMAAYRSCEGFTNEKLREAKEAFEKEAKDDKLALTDLPNTLLDMFGVHCIKHLRDLVDAAGEAITYCGFSTQPVTFHEFLVWARHLHNADLLELSEYFEKADADEDGEISFDEIRALLRDEGFTLTAPEVREFLEDAELSQADDAKYSFDDANSLVMACRESDGFVKIDLEELIVTYNKFDTEEEGELTTLQVLDLLRYLGYQCSLGQVERYAKDVDFNGNGTMDVDEYKRLMRLHREDELDKVSRVFCSHAGFKGLEGTMPFKVLLTALKESKCISQTGDNGDIFADLCKTRNLGPKTELTFEEYKKVADECRILVKRVERKHANFSPTELKELQRTFKSWDLRGNGTLDERQLLRLLHECEVPVHSVEAREEVLNLLDKARQTAIDADIPAEEVGAFRTNDATFWTMVHVWRMIARDNEAKTVALIDAARAEANFTVDEADEFQKIFNQRTQPEALDAAEQMGGRRRSMPDLQSALAPQKEQADEPRSQHAMSMQSILFMECAKTMLDFDAFKGLLGHLKMKLSSANMKNLEKKVSDLTGENESSLDFPQFLHMMRWMLDGNFANMNSHAEHIAQTAPTNPVASSIAAVSSDTLDCALGAMGQKQKSSRLLGRRKSM